MKVKGLTHGFYEIYWKTGGSSLASVGYDQKGYNWMAPCNWTSSGSSEHGWDSVSYLKLIVANPYDRSIKGIKGAGNKIKFNTDNFQIIEEHEL